MKNGFSFFTKYISFSMLLGALSVSSWAAPQQVYVKIESFSTAKSGPRQMPALFWSAASQESKKKSVLLVHGLNGAKEDWLKLANTLSKQGYDVLAMDLRNKGSSGHLRLVEDVQSSVIYLRNRPGLERQKVALVGASIGANAAAQYAASTKQMHLLIDSAVLLSPGEPYKDISFLDALRKTLVIPTLLIAAEDDAFSAESVRKAVKTCAAFCKEHLFSAGGHGTQLFQSNSSKELENLIISFIEEHK